MHHFKKTTILLVGSFVVLTAICTALPGNAANVPQTVELVRVDVRKLSTGYRTSKVIGASVVSETNEKIGKIDDLIVSPDDNKSAFVIISVGGWLGMGTHLVALPYNDLLINSNRIVLPGATKDGLKALPEFKYSTT